MDELKSEYQCLTKEKEEIEAKLADLTEILNCNANVGMEEKLVDGEGYPRSDIDVYSVRHARHQIICLQNDHKAIMKKIEEKLYQIHDCARKTQTVSSGSDSAASVDTKAQKSKPFIVVDHVTAGSPAEEAGLKPGDMVKQFGSLTANNFQKLQDLSVLVEHSKNKVIKLVIERDEQDYRLELTPHVWSGRGLLGCKVNEVKK